MPIEVQSGDAPEVEREESFDSVGTPEEEAEHNRSIEEWAEEGDTGGDEGLPEARPAEDGSGIKKPKASPPAEEKEKKKPADEKNGEMSLAYDPNARVKIKVDGEEVEVTLDQAVREYRRRAAADKRFQEASEIRKSAEAVMEKLKTNPWEALRQLGIDPDKAAADRIMAKIEEEKLAAENPSELERRRAIEQLEKEQTAKKALEKQIEEAEIKKKREEIRGRIDKQFTAALKEEKLPATPYTVARMADIVARNLREDPLWDATPAELARLVKEDLQSELARVIKGLPPDQVEAFLGADTVKALRNHDLERVRNPKLQGQPRKLNPGEGPARPRRQAYTDPDAAAKALEDWVSGG
jgi:hypothetical protein